MTMLSPFAVQTWIVSGVLLNMLAQGMVLSYPSCLLPALRAPDSPLHVDLQVASWLASSVGLASMFGFLISSFLMSWLGRKYSHALVILPGTIGWLAIYFADSIPVLMVGRVLGGITAGATVTLGAVVIGEYTSPKHRGMFLNLKTAAVCLGNMIVHILANYFHWRTVALIALAPHIAAFLIICTWCESPSWLAAKQRFKDCEEAFFWLRGYDDDRSELDNLIKQQQEAFCSKKYEYSRSKLKDFIKKFKRKDFIKPVFIILLGAILLESSGRHIFPAFAPDIIGEIVGNKTRSFYFTLILDIIITASATFSSVLVKLMKRRTLLFSTGLAALLTLSGVCTYLFLVSKEVLPKDRSWIPFSILIMYFILANLGCTPIPYAFLGEVLPLKHRSVGSAVSGLTLSLSLMIALKISPFLLSSLNVHGTFTVLGIVTSIVLLMLYFVLPETKDRTLQEIEEYFNCGRFRDDDMRKDNDDDEGVSLKMMTM